MKKWCLCVIPIYHLFPKSHESWTILSQKLMLFFQIICFDLLCRPPCLHRLCGPGLLSWAMPGSWVSEGACTVTLRSPDSVAGEHQIDPSPERSLLQSCSCTPDINLSLCYSAVQWHGIGWNIKEICSWMGTQILSPIKIQHWLSTLVATILILQTVLSYINNVLLHTRDLPCLQMYPLNICHLGCLTFTESSNFRDTLESDLFIGLWSEYTVISEDKNSLLIRQRPCLLQKKETRTGQGRRGFQPFLLLKTIWETPTQT